MHDTQRQINSIFVPGYSSSFYLHIDEKVLGLVAMLVPQIDEHKDKSTWLRMAAYKTRSCMLDIMERYTNSTSLIVNIKWKKQNFSPLKPL